VSFIFRFVKPPSENTRIDVVANYYVNNKQYKLVGTKTTIDKNGFRSYQEFDLIIYKSYVELIQESGFYNVPVLV
jgi:hypothetical protein